MPRYYFNTFHSDREFQDTEGMDHASQNDAWEEATTACGEMMRDLDGDLKPGEEWRMEVLNEQGEVVFVLRFSAETGPGHRSGPP